MAHDNHSAIVDMLNTNRYHELIPVISYMGALSVIGVIGNILVLVIYSTRFPRTSSSTYFILCLAAFDLFTCAVGMPFDIIDMTYGYDFKYPVICKALRCIRYYKVCKPLRLFPLKVTKMLIFIAVFVGVLFAWPAVLLFGESREYIPAHNSTVVQCSTETYLIGTIYPMIYFGALGGGLIVCVCFLIVLYSLVLAQLQRQNRKFNRALGDNVSRNKTSNLSNGHMNQIMVDDNSTAEIVKCTKLKRIGLDPKQKTTLTSASTRKDISIKKTTAMFFAISLVFVLSYLSCLIVIILQSMIDTSGDYQGNTATGLAYQFRQFFIRSYFVSNAVNPLIYGLLNPRFRRESANIVRRACRCCYCSYDCYRCNSPMNEGTF